MKKYIGAICSAVAGIFTFILLSLNWITTKVSSEYLSAAEKSSANGWDLMKDGSDISGYTLFKLSSIIMIILAVLLIVSAIILILQNLNILKLKVDCNKINNIILTVFVGFAVLAIIGAFVMAGDMSYSGFGLTVKSTVAFGGWAMAILAVVACVISWVMSTKKAKK